MAPIFFTDSYLLAPAFGAPGLPLRRLRARSTIRFERNLRGPLLGLRRICFWASRE